MFFRILKRVQPVGKRKGQTVYYAATKGRQYATDEEVIRKIVQRTSLAAGDVRNAMVSLGEVLCEELSEGVSVNLAQLGHFRPYVTSKMMDSPEEVTVEDALNEPKIVFYPTKAMRKAVKQIKMRMDHKA